MNFEMIGKLTMSKETDNFKPYSEQRYEPSGWIKRKLMFNVVCGDNRHTLTVDAGSFADGHGDVYTFSKGYTDDSGNKVKGETLIIPFKERLTSPKLAEVAEFRKFVIDLEKPNRRFKLEKALENVRQGKNLTDEEFAELEVEDASEATLKEAFEKSKKKRHEYISEWDFAEFIKKVIDSGKYKDKKFFIRGQADYSYSDSKERVYENLVPQRIYLADDEAEEMAEATFSIVYGENAVDEMSVEEKGRYFVNGYLMAYDSNRKATIPVPTTIVIPVAPEDADEKTKKKVEKIKNKFVVDDETFKEYGVVVSMINGAQKTEITEDMLTDEQKEDLELEIITMDDIRAELGSVYGERVKELRFIKPARGYTKGRNDTVYTAEDMIIKPVSEEVVEDIFGDDEDDDDEL